MKGGLELVESAPLSPDTMRDEADAVRGIVISLFGAAGFEPEGSALGVEVPW